MTITKKHEYIDQDGDSIVVPPSYAGFPSVVLRVTADDGDESASAYVNEADSVALALNVLGHDRPDDDPLATAFSVEDAVVTIASTPFDRDFQLNHAAALLKAVDGYDRREVRRATAEERRAAAAQSLTDAVIRLRNDGPGPFTGDEIGKLREALGRYDVELSK